MSSTRTIFTFLVLVFGHDVVFAQPQTHIDHLTEQEGLSYRWVMDIIQDHRGFMWFATYDGLNRYDGQNFVVYKHSDRDTNSLSSSQVVHVAEDSRGGIWTYGLDLVFNRIDLATGVIARITTFYEGGSLYTGPVANMKHFASLSNGDFIVLFQEKDRKSCTFWKYAPDLNVFELLLRIPTPPVTINSFSERADGKVWLLGLGAGYFLADFETGEFQEYPVDNVERILSSGVSVPVDREGYFWYPSDAPGADSGGGLGRFKISDNIDPDSIRQIRHDNTGDIWISCGDSTLYRFDVGAASLERFNDLFFGEANDYRAMPRCYVDEEGACWLGHFYGAARIVNSTSLFRSYVFKPPSGRRTGADEFSARDMVQYDSNTLIVRRHDNALFILDRAANEIRELNRTPVSGTPERLAEGIGSMFVGADRYLWTNQADKLVRTDPGTGLFQVFDGPPVTISDYRRIFQDRVGRIWWCCTAGIYLFNGDGKGMNRLDISPKAPDIVPEFSYASYDPDENRIYASYRHGIYVIDCSDTTAWGIEVFHEGEGDYFVTAILKWHDEFWLSTDKGLVQYNPITGKRSIYTRRDGLPSNIIYSVLDGASDLWVATHHGLSHFDPRRQRFTNYYQEQGLPFNEFNRWSYLKTEDGHMFFGGLYGIVGFDPEDVNTQKENHGTLNLLHMFRYDQKSDEILAVGNNPYHLPGHIVIGPYERTLSFKYVLSLYEDVSRNHYFHMLEGLEHNWVDDEDQQETRYIQVPPGEYVFRVKAMGPTGMPALNEIAIPITVRQYWYLRWWAVLGYVLIAGIAVSVLYRFQLYRRLDRQEAKRLRELEEVKSRMYTNITHEFRTPLTVMLGMNEAVKGYAEKGDLDKVYHSTEMIDRNARSLLGLVNQMLDLSRIEAGMMEVHNTHADVLAYLRYRLEAFQSFAAEKHIQIQFDTPDHEILMDFDPDRMSHIVNNLMSNAIKFTPKHGRIHVSADIALQDSGQRFLKFVVHDTGIGIAPYKLPHIFDRFYQADAVPLRKGEGTGVGLSLVHEMVKLLGGSIVAKSHPGEGAEFTVLLPITDRTASAVDPDSVTVIGKGSPSSVGGPVDAELVEEAQELPLVLIVEDHADVMYYIGMSIDQYYRIVTASDGREGIDKAIELIPDVIISDVMMPGTDGFGLCETVKRDERTSHIPVILLTAKVDNQSKLEGLEYGADAYLTKPFDQKELLIRMRNLLALRAEIQRRFANHAGSVPETNREAVFLNRIKALITEHMYEEDFDVDQLCRLSFLSRAQMHRKVTALTGQPVSRLIRTVRLDRAKELLVAGNLNVSEVADEVGFKTQSHFSRVFAETFGMSPSEFQVNSRRP